MSPGAWILVAVAIWFLSIFTVAGLLILYASWRQKRRRSRPSSSQPRASAGVPSGSPLSAMPVASNGVVGHTRSYGGTE